MLPEEKMTALQNPKPRTRAQILERGEYTHRAELEKENARLKKQLEEKECLLPTLQRLADALERCAAAFERYAK